MLCEKGFNQSAKLFPKQALVLMYLQLQSFENKAEKGEIPCNE